MESQSHDSLQRKSSQASTRATSRRSSLARKKASQTALDASSGQAHTPTASDDQSLTSFPSLSPSLEASPQDTAKTAAARPLSSKQVGESLQRTTSHSTNQSAIEDLFATETVRDGRSALFDDASSGRNAVPGTLHLQSDDSIKHLMKRVGDVTLVKQLALDLAQRDAQVTLLRRRGEERERLLKSMLQEHDVATTDVDKRLKDIERQEETAQDALQQTLRAYSIPKKGSRSFGTRSTASIDERMLEAFDDSLGSDSFLLDSSRQTSPPSLDYNRDTLRTQRQFSSASKKSLRSESIPSNTQLGAGVSKGWKDYFRPGNRTVKRSSSSQFATGKDENSQRRAVSITSSLHPPDAPKRLNSSVFMPPPPDDETATNGTRSFGDVYHTNADHVSPTADAESIASTSSYTSWALKWVAGSKGEPQKQQARQGRASSTTTGTKENDTPAKVANSKIASAARSETGASKPNEQHRGSTSLGFGAMGTLKQIQASSRNPVSMGAAASRADDASANFGPVEMDAILPEETMPPTLSQFPNRASSSDYLTDRFGFIYDQRRRRRQHEATAAPPSNKHGSQGESLAAFTLEPELVRNESTDDSERVESAPDLNNLQPTEAAHALLDGTQAAPPPKRWQDYLKISTFTTELLSHTPSVAPITSVTVADAEPERQDKSRQTSMSARGSGPALTTDHSGPAPPALSGPSSPILSSASEAQPDPVKALLDQLTEVHDSLQRERTVKWNEFLRKVRAERKRNGDIAAGNDSRSQSSATPEVLLADGEMIGVSGLGNKGKVGRAKWNEFKNLVLGGIPVSYRAKVWSECSGASNLRVPGYYDELVNSDFNDPAIVQQIQMDIPRTLTDNIFFREGQGVNKLREVLLAYARRNPDIGYCQGMNLITANLLLIMPTAEDAFWILASMIENILPERYYDSSLLTSRADQVVLRGFVSELLPQLSAHLEDLGIELEALTFQWFLSIFTDCLTAEALFRVWDVLLCINDGATFLFQVALALLKLNEKSLMQCDSPAEVYGYINQKMTDHAISIDGLIRASEGLKKEVLRDEIISRRKDAVAREEETARQREAIRKGKSKAVSAPPPSKQPSKEQTKLPRTPVEEFGRSAGGKLTRNASRLLKDDEDLTEDVGELTVKTPLPVDEEVMWHA